MGKRRNKADIRKGTSGQAELYEKKAEDLLDAFEQAGVYEDFLKKYQEFLMQAGSVEELSQLYRRLDENERFHRILNKREQLRQYDYGVEGWKAAFLFGWGLIPLCVQRQSGQALEKTTELAVNEEIIRIIDENQLYFEQKTSKKHSRRVIDVCVDVLNMLELSDKICFYAVIWDVLERIKNDASAYAVYEGAQERMIQRIQRLLVRQEVQKNVLTTLNPKMPDYVRVFQEKLLRDWDEEALLAQRKKKRKKKKSNVKEWSFLVVLIVLGAGLIFCLFQMKALKSKNAEAEMYRLKNTELESENARLKRKNVSLEEKVGGLQMELNDSRAENSNDNQNRNETTGKLTLERTCVFRRDMDATNESNIIQTLYSGTEVKVLEDNKNGWLRIEYEKTTGYIQYE